MSPPALDPVGISKAPPPSFLKPKDYKIHIYTESLKAHMGLFSLAFNVSS
jgi:hypothetical protein